VTATSLSWAPKVDTLGIEAQRYHPLRAGWQAAKQAKNNVRIVKVILDGFKF